MAIKQHTLCWDCAKATTFECSWVREFLPVKSWTAEEVHSKEFDSYIVTVCPEFVRDAYHAGLARVNEKKQKSA